MYRGYMQTAILYKDLSILGFLVTMDGGVVLESNCQDTQRRIYFNICTEVSMEGGKSCEDPERQKEQVQTPPGEV